MRSTWPASPSWRTTPCGPVVTSDANHEREQHPATWWEQAYDDTACGPSRRAGRSRASGSDCDRRARWNWHGRRDGTDTESARDRARGSADRRSRGWSSMQEGRPPCMQRWREACMCPPPLDGRERATTRPVGPSQRAGRRSASGDQHACENIDVAEASPPQRATEPRKRL